MGWYWSEQDADGGYPIFSLFPSERQPMVISLLDMAGLLFVYIHVSCKGWGLSVHTDKAEPCRCPRLSKKCWLSLSGEWFVWALAGARRLWLLRMVQAGTFKGALDRLAPSKNVEQSMCCYLRCWSQIKQRFFFLRSKAT